MSDSSRAARGLTDHVRLSQSSIEFPNVAQRNGAGERPILRQYATGLVVTDAAVIAIAIGLAIAIRFGIDQPAPAQGNLDLDYLTLGALIGFGWWAILGVFRTRAHNVLGSGPEEYTRLTRATVYFFGIVAIVSVLLRVELSRGFLAIAFPLGFGLLLLTRHLWRRWLIRARSRGEMMSNVLVIGGPESANQITRWLLRNQHAGFRVTGVWVPDRTQTGGEWLDVPDASIPVMGTSRSLSDAIRVSEARAVMVTDTEHLGSRGLKQLTWDLHGSEIDLLVSPNVMDVAGPRIHLSAVANMPFLHLEEPRFRGASKAGKAIFDRAMAVSVLLLISPLMITAAIAVKLSSQGPIIYRSERIGVGGEPFYMLKFRSMVVDADSQLAALRAMDTSDRGPLFKMREDPRVTRVGAFLRKYSIDELPQLLNVLKGEMSIVGPRPPLRQEVEQYEGDAHKRLLVKQGVTGLWQVSGRSDLDWEETLRLDLDYVENWSMVRDLQIIWRTVRAVTRGSGAY